MWAELEENKIKMYSFSKEIFVVWNIASFFMVISSKHNGAARRLNEHV